MTETRETMLTVLAAQELLYSLFARVFGKRPDEGLLEDLVSEDTAQALSLFLHDNDLAEFRFMQQSWNQGQESNDVVEYIADLYDEYFRALEAPGKMVAYPWESVYVEGAPLIFQKSTLAVRDAFRASGFELILEENVPADHLAYELLFLAMLANRGSSLLAPEASENLHHSAMAGETEVSALMSVRQVIDNQVEFLDQHVLKWVPQYCQDIQALPKSSYITGLALILAKYITANRAVLEDLQLVID